MFVPLLIAGLSLGTLGLLSGTLWALAAGLGLLGMLVLVTLVHFIAG